MKKIKKENNTNTIAIVILVLLSIKVGQYVYKNEQESKRNVYYNTPTSEQVEKIKKLTEKLKKKEKLNNE